MFEKTIDFIQKIYKTREHIPLHAPVFIGNEKKYLNELHVATKVKGCVITSLSFSTPASNNDMCTCKGICSLVL